MTQIVRHTWVREEYFNYFLFGFLVFLCFRLFLVNFIVVVLAFITVLVFVLNN